MENLVLLVAIVILVGLAIAARRITAPRAIRIKGFVPDPAHWIPTALDSACSSWKSASGWSWEIIVPDDGESDIAVARIRSRSSDEILLHFPLTAEGTYTSDRPYTILLEMTEFKYRTQWAYRIALGKYPQNHVLRMRTRLIRVLPRKARKSSQSEEIREKEGGN